MKQVKNSVNNLYFNEKRDFFDEGGTLDIKFRKKQLKNLKQSILKNEKVISEALHKDLRKSETESYITEISFVLSEIKHMLDNIAAYSSPEKRSTPIFIEPAKSEVRLNPKGLVLIVSPWNYPFQLCLVPLIGAIAAGNCAVLKPSEDAPATAAIIEKIVSEVFNNNFVSVVLGQGHLVIPTILENHTFNHIFFTGSTAVGVKIAEMAAKTLTSTTLELGGKSPAIVDANSNVKLAARRIAWGKLMNAGQTCVSPDYLIIHKDVKQAFVEAYIMASQEMYGLSAKDSKSYPRIINERRFDTLVSYLKEGNIIYGGDFDKTDLYISPTLMDHVNFDMRIMKDEIFGPILPILIFKTAKDVISIVRKNRYPLACYYFGNDVEMKRIVSDRLEYGGGCINDTMIHLSNPNLPFGGIQTSGSGAYHGRESFMCFSHQKSMITAKTWIDIKLRYPPYSFKKLKWLKRII